MDRSKLPSLSMSMSTPPNNICNDIIVEILSWLPVDSLLRFKSVSKSWFSLITNPIFAKLQTAKAQIHNPTIMFISRTNYSLKSMDKLVSSPTVLEKLEMVYPFDSTKYVCYNVGSCNGLICICLIPASYYDHPTNNRNETLGLWNPSTKEFKQLPSHEEVENGAPFKFPPYRDGNGRRRRRRSVSKVANYGFGYDHVMKDYKVIASVQWFSTMDDSDEYDEMDDDDEEVMNHYQLYHYELKVYTLGTDSWRRIQGTPYEREWSSNRPWLHANGAFHRIAKLSSSDTRIFSFDIVEEVQRQVWNPPDCFYTRPWKLAVLRGCLCLCSFVERSSTEVWMMMNYGVKESWIKSFMITTTSEEYIYLFKPVRFCRNGELLMENETHPKLVIYDPKLSETKLLISPSNTIKFWVGTVIYVASLVSLKSQKEREKELIIC